MIRIAICDDEIGTCSEIENIILAYANGHALQIEIEIFYSGETLYQNLLWQCDYDVIFLDIELLELDGVQVGKKIREELKNEKISIIYISSHENYALSLFQVRPFDFLLKPITIQKVYDTLDKFLLLFCVNKEAFYYQCRKSHYKIMLDEILYFACSGKKIEVHTLNGFWEFYGTMQQVFAQVEGKGFWIIHKSYIINSVYISIFHYDKIEMVNHEVLPISEKYRKKMKENLTNLYREIGLR